MLANNVVLTDFNLDKWSRYTRQSIVDCLNELDSVLYGQFGHPNDEQYDYIFDPVVMITNIQFKYNVCTADVKFMTEEAWNYFQNGGRFSVRSYTSGDEFKMIITWDLV